MLIALAGLGCLLSLWALGWLLLIQVYPFLALSKPIAADILVIEGWLPDYALEAIAVELRQGAYGKIITLGGPLRHGYFLSQYKSYAALAAATLAALGVDANQIVAIPIPHTDRDRTKTSALHLKAWLAEHDPTVAAINLYSLGPHARRSWFLFQQTLRPAIQVGTLTAAPKDYQPQTWWNYSAGVRSVLSEIVGYVYAVTFSVLTQSKALEGLDLKK
jgi:hypothetical protein